MDLHLSSVSHRMNDVMKEAIYRPGRLSRFRVSGAAATMGTATAVGGPGCRGNGRFPYEGRVPSSCCRVRVS